MLETVITLAIVGIVIALVARWMGVRNTGAESAVSKLKSNVSEAEQRYQEVLRRELANIIQDINLEDFEKAFYKMRDFEDEMARADDKRRKAELAVLVQKYELFSDFDLIGTWHFVRYDREQGSEEYIERYYDISKFLILNRKSSSRRLYDDEEVKVFQRNIKRQKALRLESRLKEAMDRLHRHQRSVEKESGKWIDNYEDADFYVSYLVMRNSPESAYGIVCKKTDEYGVYTLFVDDEGKSYESYYRSNKAFAESADESL